MAEAFNTRELTASLGEDVPKFPIDDRPKAINDLPNDVLVSVFIAVADQRWVRHTVPLVCKEWAELYRSQDASPLHETLEVDFWKEGAAAREGATTQRGPLGRLIFHASRVIQWTERLAGSVRTLHLAGKYSPAQKDFSPEDLGRLVTVTASSLTKLRIGWGLDEQYKKRFWESLRDFVAPAGRLRSLVVEKAGVSESDVEPLGQLAGSLSELVLNISYWGNVEYRLPRFPESLCALTELRRLELKGHEQITAIPAQISSLKKLEELRLGYCRLLSSLPKELAELSKLRTLDLAYNKNLGNAPQGEAFPAELGKMESLRVLNLSSCGLRAVPAFVGELESLESLDLCNNYALQIDAPLDFLIRGCPRLREVNLVLNSPYINSKFRAHIKAFKARLLAENPNAKVYCA